MKMWKKLLTSVLSAVMVFTLLSTGAFAAETNSSLKKQSYTYTVTFYAGNHGTFGDNAVPTVETKGVAKIVKSSDKIVVSGLLEGDKVGMNSQSAVTLAADSKYYPKGIRLSGRDNDTVAESVFEVTGDADYVAAYGIKGQQVKYTVKYVHENGKKLAEDEVFYGNIGDKPIVAYKYIQGYNPKVYAFTKTLDEDESKNIFEFVYTDATSPTIEEIVTEDVTYSETVITINGGTTAVGGVAGGTGGGATNVTGGGADQAAPGEDETGDVRPAYTGPEDDENGGSDLIVDLDDEETPLANIDADGNANGNMAPMALYIGMGLLAIIAIIASVYVYKKLKKKEA